MWNSLQSPAGYVSFGGHGPCILMPGQTRQGSGPQNITCGDTWCRVVTFPYTYACRKNRPYGELGQKGVRSSTRIRRLAP